jgi:hypothetical protein
MCPQDLRSDDASLMINGMPEPALVAFLPNETPHLIALRFFPWLDLTTDRARSPVLDGQIVDVLELRRLFSTVVKLTQLIDLPESVSRSRRAV